MYAYTITGGHLCGDRPFFWLVMLHAVQIASRLLRKEIGEGVYYDLAKIVNAVEACTVVDKVIYTGYEVLVSNPIKGSFWKFSQVPNSYAAQQTTVEVRYAVHLDLPWRRFVVCKELCHALDSDEGTHSVTARSIDRILSRFALYSSQKPITTTFPAFDAESLAEIGALELLCPLAVRKERVSSDEKTQDDLCKKFGIPDEYGFLAFDPEMTEAVEAISG